jgi:hypothetical protein
MMAYVAVAPTYEIDPTMPHVYKAARERIAGLKRNIGLRVAAWQALNAYEESKSKLNVIVNLIYYPRAKRDVFVQVCRQGCITFPS